MLEMQNYICMGKERTSIYTKIKKNQLGKEHRPNKKSKSMTYREKYNRIF